MMLHQRQPVTIEIKDINPYQILLTNGTNTMFDNNDKRIKYYELLLEKDIELVEKYPLPVGYHFEFYQDGDRDFWIEIEKSAKEFATYEEGLDAWNRYYADKEDELLNRMIFVVNGLGEKVATATAFYDVHGNDKSGSAWLHWVAVKRDYQGKGLSKPLITHTLNIMKALGYTHAKIPTQTNTWLAVKIYLDLGFKPISENAVSSYNGWCIIKTLTNHTALTEFKSMEELEIYYV